MQDPKALYTFIPWMTMGQRIWRKSMDVMDAFAQVLASVFLTTVKNQKLGDLPDE